MESWGLCVCMGGALTSRGGYAKVGVVKWRIGLAGFALGVATTLGLTATVGRGPHAAAPATLDHTVFDRTLEAVFARYVEPVDEQRVFAAGLRAMLTELDPHSHFLTASERKTLRRRADGGTTGMAVALKLDRSGDPRVEVMAVAPNSPAAKHGVRPGDRWIRIGDREVDELRSQVELELLLAGAIGDELALALQSPDVPDPRELHLVLTETSSRAVESAIVTTEDGRRVIHVIVRRFSRESGDAVKRAIATRRRAIRGTVAGIVLDLRGNPGGEVDEALVVADLFVKDGVLTRTRGRGGRVLREEIAHAAGTDAKTRLVVLQDRHSASASELLAAALQDHHRATIVGERSYGKGTVQEVLGLPDGSVATFTIARYYAPSDRVIDGVGVTPDVVLALTPTMPVAGDLDVGLRAAIDVLSP